MMICLNRFLSRFLYTIELVILNYNNHTLKAVHDVRYALYNDYTLFTIATVIFVSHLGCFVLDDIMHVSS